MYRTLLTTFAFVLSTVLGIASHACNFGDLNGEVRATSRSITNVAEILTDAFDQVGLANRSGYVAKGNRKPMAVASAARHTLGAWELDAARKVVEGAHRLGRLYLAGEKSHIIGRAAAANLKVGDFVAAKEVFDEFNAEGSLVISADRGRVITYIAEHKLTVEGLQAAERLFKKLQGPKWSHPEEKGMILAEIAKYGIEEIQLKKAIGVLVDPQMNFVTPTIAREELGRVVVAIAKYQLTPSQMVEASLSYNAVRDSSPRASEAVARDMGRTLTSIAGFQLTSSQLQNAKHAIGQTSLGNQPHGGLVITEVARTYFLR